MFDQRGSFVRNSPQLFATIRSEGPFAVPVREASKRIIFGDFKSREVSFLEILEILVAGVAYGESWV